RAMQRVRRREDDGVDVGVRQCLLVGLMERQLVRGAERLVVVRLRPRRRCDKLDVRTHLLDGLDEGLPPPAESDLCGLDHAVVRMSDIFGSAARLSVTGSPSSFLTTLVPCTS